LGGRFAAGRRGWAEEEEGKGREGEVEGGKGSALKLLLNQGPSEPCYATVFIGPTILCLKEVLYLLVSNEHELR